jgi:hypothetical protein
MARHPYSRRTKRRITPALLIIGAIVAVALIVNLVPRVVSLFRVSTASADTLEPPERTAIVQAVVARPSSVRDGACTQPSAFVPRADAWACTVGDQLFDPCFEAKDLDAPTAIVCGADAASGAVGFAVRDAVPPAPAAEMPHIDSTAFASLPVTIELIGAPVTLVNGQYYAPNVEATGGSVLIAQSNLRAEGDLDGDGDADAAGLLVADAGDGRMFIYLYAVRNDAGTPAFAGSIELGDRVKVDALDITNGQIHVAMTTHTGEDPACCPTLDVDYTYNLVDGTRIAQYVNGWRLELQGGIQCLPMVQQPIENGPRYAYQCSNGAWLREGLVAGRVWYAQLASSTVNEPGTASSYVPVVRIWQ